MTDWVNGRYVYRYDLVTGEYRGKLHLRPVPQWQQGIAYLDGHIYITADDGDADLDEADNLWRVVATPDGTAAFVEHVLEFTDFRRAGEIEGVTFDRTTGELIVLSNRGARIVLGMPSGFYPGYDREVHEVYVYAPIARGETAGRTGLFDTDLREHYTGLDPELITERRNSRRDAMRWAAIAACLVE